MSNFWGMFEDGDSALVLMESLGAAENESLTLYCHNPNMIMDKARDGAEQAIFACHSALSKRELVTGHKVFSYQFRDLTAPVTQTSASLAFGLKLVDVMQNIPFNVAATGGISDGTSFAAVRRINGINQKINGIFTKLKKGDVIFYPEANCPSDQADKEADFLHPKLAADAEAKGIKMVPVATMDEAVEKLLKLKSAAENSPKKNTAPVEDSPEKTTALVEDSPEKTTAPVENSPEETTAPVLRRFLPAAWVALVLISLCLVLVYVYIFLQKTSDDKVQEKQTAKTAQPKPADPVQLQELKVALKQASKRVQISLTGDGEGTPEIRSLLEQNLSAMGFKTDFGPSQAQISGRITVTDFPPQPLRPYAGPEDTLVKREIRIDNLTYTPHNGSPVVLGQVTGIFETTKDKAHELTRQAVNQLKDRLGTVLKTGILRKEGRI